MEPLALHGDEGLEDGIQSPTAKELVRDLLWCGGVLDLSSRNQGDKLLVSAQEPGSSIMSGAFCSTSSGNVIAGR